MLMPERRYSATRSYRYGFNGKENDNEVKGEGNSLDFGDRMYDPRIVRWLSIDKFFKKAPFFTPYQYAGNSPLTIIDNKGDSLRVNAQAAEITKFQTVMSAGFDGQIQVRVNAIGIVSLHGNTSNLTQTQKALYNALNTVISDQKTTDVVLLNTNQRNLATGGAFRGATVRGKAVNTIDLYDFEKWGTEDITKQSLIIHEIWETFQDQVKGQTDFGKAHAEAINQQGNVSGVEITSQWGDQSYATTGSGKGYTLYKKGDKYYTLVATIVNMNVTGTTVQKGWIGPFLDKNGNPVVTHADDDEKKNRAVKDNTYVGSHLSGN